MQTDKSEFEEKKLPPYRVMLSEAKHLKHTVGLHSVLDFVILRFALFAMSY